MKKRPHRQPRLEVSSNPEYSTPECDDIFELLVQEKAGERILESCLPAAEERLREEGLSGDIFLFKNNTDSLGNTYGCHENFLMRRDVDLWKEKCRRAGLPMRS